jgi:hypothetical protein
MGASIGYEGIRTATSGDFERQRKFMNDLIIGGYGFSKGGKLLEIAQKGTGADVITLIPGIERARISDITTAGTHGESGTTLPYGYTFRVAGINVFSVRDVGGIKGEIGLIGAPESILKGKTTQSFAKAETKYFIETVDQFHPFDKLYVESATELAAAIYKTNKPVFTPESFKATSTAIPKRWQPAVEHSIKYYEGKTTIAGSRPMQDQAGKAYVSRETHDVEMYVDEPLAFAAYVTKMLIKEGAVKNRDFKVSGGKNPKIDFKLEDGTFDTGIEIFKHGVSNQGYGNSGPLESAKGDLAYGYKSKSLPKTMVRAAEGTVKEFKSIFSDIAKEQLKIDQPLIVGKKGQALFAEQKLSEQFIRKVAGSTMLKEATISKAAPNEPLFYGGKLTVQPQHMGRLKDVGDVVTMATAYIAEGKINSSYERTLVNFVNAANEKFGSVKDFKEKVLTDPVFKYILKNQKVPNKTALSTMTSVKVSDSVLLLKKTTEALNLKSAEKLKLERERISSIKAKNESPSPRPTHVRRSRSPSPAPKVKKSSSPSPAVKVKTRSKSPTPVIKARSKSPSPAPKPSVRGKTSPSPNTRKSGRTSPSPSPSPKVRRPSPKPGNKSTKSSSPAPARITTKEIIPIAEVQKRRKELLETKKLFTVLKSKRLIKNKLGSFESMFGGSSKKPAAKKVTKKPAAKKPAVKRTTTKKRRTSSK